MILPPPHPADGRLALTEPELVAWGERLGRAITAPLCVTLAGDLGAGKTTLVQAICRGYGVRDDVTSPTFALVHEYRGGPTVVYHLDLYRLKHPSELVPLGWDDLLSERALVVVEWPERAGEMLPAVPLAITLAHVPGEPGRRLLLTGGHAGATAFGGDDT
ncbi:MAG: tRNA (adenosine(37)-N6)-threonylcarbamoyltransferase complex ATPase subunit type 1 TsaE [Gemmatimonadaceae bacterium]|nr:tRNA (adenosine(37)-N6)-threonylcarbamoyltransferase complex ATPase subunit type 1 TsaE [Gemmatimonadaceae bacterium]